MSTRGPAYGNATTKLIKFYRSCILQTASLDYQPSPLLFRVFRLLTYSWLKSYSSLEPPQSGLDPSQLRTHEL